jgi:hypothetical protein
MGDCFLWKSLPLFTQKVIGRLFVNAKDFLFNVRITLKNSISDYESIPLPW